jgi:hypothetical protein
MSDDIGGVLVRKRAIDVTPYLHGVRASFASEPGRVFTTEIAGRSWADDGEAIWFMLETHNFMKHAPDEMIEVVELNTSCPADLLDRVLRRDAEEMRSRPGQLSPLAFEVSDVY